MGGTLWLALQRTLPSSSKAAFTQDGFNLLSGPEQSYNPPTGVPCGLNVPGLGRFTLQA